MILEVFVANHASEKIVSGMSITVGHAHLSTTADLYLTIDPRALVDAVAAVKARSDAAHAQPHQSAEAVREQYAFAYDAVTIEELERAVTAMRSPIGERP